MRIILNELVYTQFSFFYFKHQTDDASTFYALIYFCISGQHVLYNQDVPIRNFFFSFLFINQKDQVRIIIKS